MKRQAVSNRGVTTIRVCIPTPFPHNPCKVSAFCRVFTNVNPQGKARLWHIGEPFPAMAEKFLPLVRRPLPGKHAVFHALGVTKSPRTEYDHIMLRFHDLQKADLAYQKSGASRMVLFSARSDVGVLLGSSHARRHGRPASFRADVFLPVGGQQQPHGSPSRILEKMTGRRLAA